ncbi:hypothetical protein C0992_009407 [Termitomyces sp. T32_za158]|nr:hypothetical protein C0992_009407 [Termitomyces sp. T32_za158]
MSLSPLVELAKIILTSASKIDEHCTKHKVQLPDMEEPFNPQAEFILLEPSISEYASHIVAAAAQISLLVKPAALSILTIATQVESDVAIETDTAEILREAGPQGLHIKELASRNQTDPEKLARVLRLLATEHIFTEISPDVFANNRLSSVLDTGKRVEEIKASPAEKHDGTSGLVALAGHFSDEVYKSSAFLVNAMKDRSFGISYDTNKTAFNLAFRTDLPIFSYFTSPGNEELLHRFNIGCEGASNLFPPRGVVEGFDWKAYSKGVVVDVGGGIGSQSMVLAKDFPNLSFVVQDLEPVISDASKFWEATLPEAIATGHVILQVHDFFQPQPVKAADIYFLRMILHDWADENCIKILRNLRAAAAPHSKLFIVESVLLYACKDTDSGGAKQSGQAPPPPLLPNYGHANAFAYTVDIQMMVLMNSKERTFQQFRRLLASAGWELQDTVLKPPFKSVHQFLVALPV